MNAELDTRSGSGADSDAESIFSSASYSALSDGSDEEHSGVLDTSNASSHAFQRLKDLLQQRDEQLAQNTDQQSAEHAPLEETTAKALQKVRSISKSTESRILGCKFYNSLSFSLGYSFQTSSQTSGPSAAKSFHSRQALHILILHAMSLKSQPLQHNAAQLATQKTQISQQRKARQHFSQLPPRLQSCSSFRLKKLQLEQNGGRKSSNKFFCYSRSWQNSITLLVCTKVAYFPLP